MILSGKTIKALGIIHPYLGRTEFSRGDKLLSYGCGLAGYDVRCEFDTYGEIASTTLFRGDFILASTIEYFRLPNNVVGIVHDKSSWARRGLAVQNTVLEPGWEGHLTLELSMHGTEGIVIHRKDPVAQVIFHFTDESTDGYNGKYQCQARGPQHAR